MELELIEEDASDWFRVEVLVLGEVRVEESGGIVGIERLVESRVLWVEVVWDG